MNDHTTPPWPDAACPPWCTRRHDPGDHPEDRRHQGAVHLVTLEIAAARPASSPETTPVDVVVHADRPVGASEDRLRIESTESPEVRLALTARSTHELIRALRNVLEEISG